MSGQNLQNQVIFFKGLREYLDWTQVKLASEIGVSKQTIIRWEKGRVIPRQFVWNRLKEIFEKVPIELEIKRQLKTLAALYISKPQKLNPGKIFSALEEQGMDSKIKARIVREFPDLKLLPFRQAFAEYIRRKPSVEKRMLATEIVYQRNRKVTR